MSTGPAPTLRFLTVPLLAAALLCACSHSADTSSTSTTTNAGATAPSAAAVAAAPADAQTNPPGDIPDTQAFVTYSSPEGNSVLVPEGWSRTVSGSTVTFTSHYNGERITVRNRGGKPIPHSYLSSSPPDAVTGKSIRLEHNVYVYPKGSRIAVLDLWAPQGSDNVDQWKKIAQSFRWK
jgi:hypothetical protein